MTSEAADTSTSNHPDGESQGQALPADSLRPRRQPTLDESDAPVDVDADDWRARIARYREQGWGGPYSRPFGRPAGAPAAGPRNGEPGKGDPRHRAAGGPSDHARIDRAIGRAQDTCARALVGACGSGWQWLWRMGVLPLRVTLEVILARLWPFS